jgi:hypothetical protein
MSDDDEQRNEQRAEGVIVMCNGQWTQVYRLLYSYRTGTVAATLLYNICGSARFLFLSLDD